MWRASGHRIFALLAAAQALAGFHLEAATRRPTAINFPGDGVKEVRSRTGVTVFFTDPGINVDGLDERPIMLRYPTGRSERIDTFTRNADISWSPMGNYLAVTNWIGSNVADCSIITPSPSGAQKQSMTTLIGRLSLVASRDIRNGDHVYVSCVQWRSPVSVEIRINGYGFLGSSLTVRPFDHSLNYNVRTGRLTPSSDRPRSKRFA